jgi:hypothetical protein
MSARLRSFSPRHPASEKWFAGFQEKTRRHAVGGDFFSAQMTDIVLFCHVENVHAIE